MSTNAVDFCQNSNTFPDRNNNEPNSLDSQVSFPDIISRSSDYKPCKNQYVIKEGLSDFHSQTSLSKFLLRQNTSLKLPESPRICNHKRNIIHNNSYSLHRSLSSKNSLFAFSNEYKEFLSELNNIRFSSDKIVDISIIAFFNHDIDQDKFIEIITRSDQIADAFINKIDPQLKLSSGIIVHPNEFFQDPLFKDTKEKKAVFIKLYLFLNSPFFTQEYQDFLSSLNHKNWFEAYSRTPEKLALLSLIAFHDGRINKEELFVINMVSSAFHEISTPESTLEKIDLKVLNTDEIIEYLKESGFPPFAANTRNYIIATYNRISPEEIQDNLEDFLQKYSKRSIVERTFIEYTLKNSSINYIEHFTIEMLIHYVVGCDVGFKKVDKSENITVVLAAPHFAIELYRWASSIPSMPADAHHFMFGFNKDAKPLFNMIRPISIPSTTLFKLPLVHDCERGSELGVLTHDLNYHIPLEVINPHVDIFVGIASLIKDYAEKKLQDSPQFSYYTNSCKKFCEEIIDRETNGYRVSPNPVSAFWTSIYASLMIFENDFHSQSFSSLLEKVFYPAIASAIAASESGKNIRTLTLDELKKELLIFQEINNVMQNANSN